MRKTLRIFPRIHNGTLDYIHCELWSYGVVSVMEDQIDCGIRDLPEIFAEFAPITLVSLQKSLPTSDHYAEMRAVCRDSGVEFVSVAG